MTRRPAALGWLVIAAAIGGAVAARLLVVRTIGGGLPRRLARR